MDIPEEYLDIVQIVSVILILIPTIARAGKDFWKGTESDKVPPEALAEDVTPKSNRLRRKMDEKKNKRSKEADKRSESLRPQPKTLIKDVLRMLLQDVFTEGDTWPPPMTADLIEGILMELGEHERAQNTELIRAMMDAASSPSGLLDEEAFVNALTSDLED